MSDERFALVREPEAAALKKLSSNAAKAFIAIKFGRRDGEDIAFGVRELEEWGLKKTTASEAMNELVEAGLLEVRENSAFGRKRKKRVYRVTHTRDACKPQSAPPDTRGRHSPAERTMTPAAVRQAGHKRALQSGGPDTTRRLPSTSSQEVEGEGSQEAAAREASLKALRDRQRRIEAVAREAAMTSVAFMAKAGGPSAADFLARKFERGELTALQLNKALADPPNGSARESVAQSPRRLAFAAQSGEAIARATG